MKINIAYWANEKYSEYAYISILSVLKNLNHNSINCFLITTKNNKRIKIIKDLENIYSNFEFKTIIIDDDDIKNIQMSKKHHITYHCFYRFYIDKIEWIEKIIYLDCDTIALRDISQLFEENISKEIIWITSDIPCKTVKNRIQELKLKWEKYFNSGVMVINLEKRKKNKVSEKWINLVKENVYQCWDQDALNIILEKQCKYLKWAFNVQTEYFEINKNNFYSIGFDKDYYNIAVKDPIILHFTLAWKPRDLLNNHPRRRDYDKMRWFSIYIRLTHLLNPQISIKDFIIIVLHTFENVLFPKHENKKLVRNSINKIIHIINNKIHN